MGQWEHATKKKRLNRLAAERSNLRVDLFRLFALSYYSSYTITDLIGYYLNSPHWKELDWIMTAEDRKAYLEWEIKTPHLTLGYFCEIWDLPKTTKKFER